MAEVVKTLKIEGTRHTGFTNVRMRDRKVSLTINWINARFNSLQRTRRLENSNTEVVVIFYFNDPVEATWFKLMFKQEMIKV